MCVGIAFRFCSPALNSAALNGIRGNEIPLLRKREYRTKARLDALERFVRQVFGSIEPVKEILCVQDRKVPKRDFSHALL